jgi:RimJ/RimL family protein N-acetyltransferase
MSNIIIRPIAENDIEDFNAAVGEVARERDYLTFLDNPPMNGTDAFVRDNIANGHPQFIAITDNKIIGWCDITPDTSRVVHEHKGTLGIGILKPYRGQGLGRRLMNAAIQAAKEKGLQRIELKVRTTNTNAFMLYQKLGFVLEGTMRKEWHVDGVYYDTHFMALWLDDRSIALG